jgi:hypothetical protein
MALSNDPQQGYLLEDVVNGRLNNDEENDSLEITLNKIGNGWEQGYLWVHRRALYSLLNGFIKIPRFPINGAKPKKRMIFCYSGIDVSSIYFIVFQNENIDEDKAENIFRRAQGAAKTKSPWGPFPALNDWGHIELWDQAGCYQVTSFGKLSLNRDKTIVNRIEAMNINGSNMSAIVMVLPIDIGVF